MKKKLLLIFISILSSGLIFGQPPGGGPRQEKREKIKAQKIAFISTELELTPDEAEKFWPIYNTYEADVEALHKERKQYKKELRNADKLSDDRIYELFELIFTAEKKESEVRQNYLKKFADLLGIRKAAKVFIAEEKFRRLLLDRLKSDRGGPPPPTGDRP